jgi:hypothetical protein
MPCGQAPAIVFDEGDIVRPAHPSVKESLGVQQGPQLKGGPAAGSPFMLLARVRI